MAHVPDRLKKIRHGRFLELLDKYRAVELAKLLSKPDNYISNVKNQRKAIGEDLAREWEQTLGLPKYWFDGNDQGSQIAEPKSPYHGVYLTRAGALLAAEWEKLDIQDRVEVEEIILTKVAAMKRQQRRKRPEDPKNKQTD